MREHSRMGFNRRKMEDERRRAAEKKAAEQRATDSQISGRCGTLGRRLERTASQTNADAVFADHWRRHRRRLLVSVGALPGVPDYQRHRPAPARSHHDAAITSLIPALSCRSCRPNAPFAEVVRLSRKSVADEMREEHQQRVLGDK
jgi:hypothetical protein